MTKLYRDNLEQDKRTNEEIEDAFNHLLCQFRQIDEKYGLMVGEQINMLYDQRIELIASSKGLIRPIEKRPN